MNRDAIVEAAKRYMAMRTVEPLTLHQLFTVVGGCCRRTFYRAMYEALVDVTSGIVVVLEARLQRGGHRRVWTLTQAVDARLEVVLGEEAWMAHQPTRAREQDRGIVSGIEGQPMHSRGKKTYSKDRRGPR